MRKFGLVIISVAICGCAGGPKFTMIGQDQEGNRIYEAVTVTKTGGFLAPSTTVVRVDECEVKLDDHIWAEEKNLDAIKVCDPARMTRSVHAQKGIAGTVIGGAAAVGAAYLLYRPLGNVDHDNSTTVNQGGASAQGGSGQGGAGGYGGKSYAKGGHGGQGGYSNARGGNSRSYSGSYSDSKSNSHSGSYSNANNRVKQSNDQHIGFRVNNSTRVNNTTHMNRQMPMNPGRD